MLRIDTDVPDIIVEIEDREYTLAPRSVEIMEKLAEAEKANMGKPVYRLWLAELEIILGKPACRELFHAGGRENVDRLQMIYAGVAQAFRHTERELTASRQEAETEAVATALAPLNELLRNLKAFDKRPGDRGNIREIPRPQK